ncbi:hypothetical protein GCM10023082_23380 [Streptomyces tremellae]|uniref:Uncharacterized protein n=1 Tax=Streptomyces tremellae TaxID=1124239 RepID=A0ABP7ETX3_9ACTN
MTCGFPAGLPARATLTGARAGRVPGDAGHLTAHDTVSWAGLPAVRLPLAVPVGDVRALAGPSRPMTEVGLPFADIATAHGRHGLRLHVRHVRQRGGGSGRFTHDAGAGPPPAPADR